MRALPVANPGDGPVITSFIDDTQEGLNKDQIFPMLNMSMSLLPWITVHTRIETVTQTAQVLVT